MEASRPPLANAPQCNWRRSTSESNATEFPSQLKLHTPRLRIGCVCRCVFYTRQEGRQGVSIKRASDPVLATPLLMSVLTIPIGVDPI